jgi:hypothetical protein
MNEEGEESHQDAEGKDLPDFIRSLFTKGRKMKTKTNGTDIAPGSQHPDPMFFDILCSN